MADTFIPCYLDTNKSVLVGFNFYLLMYWIFKE